MDHVGDALATDRADGEVDLVEPEAVGRDQFEREALGGKLRQGKLAGLVAMTARAFHGDEFHRELFQREIRKLSHLALSDDHPSFAFERLDAEQHRNGAGAGGAVERDVDAFAAGNRHDAGERILPVDVDDVIGAKLLGDVKPRFVLRGTGDDDQRGTGLFADHGLRQPLLAGALDQHRRIVADAAVEQRPLDAIGHWRHQSGELRGDALGYVMHDRVPWQVDVLGEAAPQMRRPFRRGVAVADGVGIGAPVGVLAMPVLSGMTPLAFATRDIVLDENEIALLESLAAGEFAAGLGDGADIFVAHDHWSVRRRMFVGLDVGAADATDFHFHQRGILRNLRHRKFAQLGPALSDPYRRQYLLHDLDPFSVAGWLDLPRTLVCLKLSCLALPRKAPIAAEKGGVFHQRGMARWLAILIIILSLAAAALCLWVSRFLIRSSTMSTAPLPTDLISPMRWLGLPL